MESQTITLWTRQVTQVWQTLQEDGVYFCKEAYIREKNDTIADYYLELYRWYTREAGKHIAIPAERPYPIWLSLDENLMLQPVENTVILRVEAPADRVLLCNYDAWGVSGKLLVCPDGRGGCGAPPPGAGAVRHP